MEDINNLSLDTTPVVLDKTEVTKTSKTKAVKAKKEEENQSEETLVNPLQNVKINVKFHSRKQGIWGNDPKHVLAGGMSDSAKRTFVVPVLSSGRYVNVLTNSEKTFFEHLLGLEKDALSIYRKVDNFWDNSNDMGINKVTLSKSGNILDLSIPEDYIKYKILLANKNFIAPSMQALQDMPLASYEFVIIKEDEEVNTARTSMNATMKAYTNLGKISEDKDKMQLVIETILGKPISSNSKLEVFQTKLNELIQADAKVFNSVVEDKYLDTKILIKKAVREGLIAKRGNYYYYVIGGSNQPLCDINQDPTFNTAAIYLNSPKHNDLLMALESKLGD